jgi:MFS family permease
MPWLREAWDRRGAGLPAAFWWLFAGSLVNSLASFLVAFLALFLTARGFTVEETGLVVALFGAGTVVAGPVAGAVADRLGRRPTILFSLLVSGALTGLLGAIRAPVAIGAAVLLIGLISNGYRPAAAAVVADVVPAPDRSKAFGFLYWAGNLGMAVSAAGGGLLASLGWGVLFLVDSATTLLFALLVWRRIPESRPAPGEGAGGAAARGYAAVLGDRVLLAFLGLQLVLMMAFLQFLVALPVEMARGGFGPAVYGRVIAVNGVLIVALQPVAARRLARADTGAVLAAGAALVGLGYGGYALCRTAWHYALATAVWSLGEILVLPVASAVVASLAPPDLRGRYQGLYSLAFGLAMIASPLAGASALGRLGPAALWAACLVFSLLVALGHLAAGPARRRRLAGGAPPPPGPAGAEGAGAHSPR